ncbi:MULTISPECIES: rhodanese-like domain-containing protein [unclassified Neisseria]|uniref:rhodanese-like domain-containing protein n=1 Tax=unclassified Neisseria TaxID=2623750 RepID=UPI001071703D|nr:MULTISPECIES: rhodanese-like domain-containing protein [unclassified Neisseria]MBF0804986.1 rhodanese-like domain-containing protein [Neisseria sp. 19428wB4_WF04]TFU39293.1 rhodanese-like domain-containing protein [Neisseria sp. WF04]
MNAKLLSFILGAAMYQAASADVLIDVRTPDEHAQSHIPNAVLMPVDTVKNSISTVVPDKTETVYLYCRSGNRAEHARQTLLAMGYTDVKNLGSLENARVFLQKHPQTTTAIRTPK